jgi:hypothetical protein
MRKLVALIWVNYLVYTDHKVLRAENEENWDQVKQEQLKTKKITAHLHLEGKMVRIISLMIWVAFKSKVIIEQLQDNSKIELTNLISHPQLKKEEKLLTLIQLERPNLTTKVNHLRENVSVQIQMVNLGGKEKNLINWDIIQNIQKAMMKNQVKKNQMKMRMKNLSSFNSWSPCFQEKRLFKRQSN